MARTEELRVPAEHRALRAPKRPDPPGMTGPRFTRQPRASLSPSLFSKDDFKKFKRTDAHATKESRVAICVMLIIEGDPGDTRCIASDVPFTNLEYLTDGYLVCAKPDQAVRQL